MDKFKNSSLRETLDKVLGIPGDLYLDGLFITEISQNILLETGEYINFILFTVTRDWCLKNDKKRRKLSSRAIIENAKVHVPENYKEVL